MTARVEESADAAVLVRTTAEGTVAVLTLNRPEDRNPLDRVTLGLLHECLRVVSASPEVQAIVITGAGEAFSAGGDMKGYQHLFRHPDEFHAFMETFAAVCDLLETCPQVTVAMVNGVCVAGGLEIALACDLITMADDAMIGDGHLRFAQLPGAGSSQRLVRAIGVQRAKQWLLTARLFTAAEAVDAGLAVAAFPAGQLFDRTVDLVSDSTRHSPLARQRMKELIRVAVDTVQTEGLRSEVDVALSYASTSHDAFEGLLAFAERRPPRYLGR